jgi:hypothetical protein
MPRRKCRTEKLLASSLMPFMKPDEDAAMAGTAAERAQGKKRPV